MDHLQLKTVSSCDKWGIRIDFLTQGLSLSAAALVFGRPMIIIIIITVMGHCKEAQRTIKKSPKVSHQKTISKDMGHGIIFWAWQQTEEDMNRFSRRITAPLMDIYKSGWQYIMCQRWESKISAKVGLIIFWRLNIGWAYEDWWKLLGVVNVW